MEFVDYLQLPHYRFEHVQDNVVHQPSIWQGYRHGGTQIRLGKRGGPQASKQSRETAFPAALGELVGARRQGTGVHAITDYIDVLFEAIREGHAHR